MDRFPYFNKKKKAKKKNQSMIYSIYYILCCCCFINKNYLFVISFGWDFLRASFHSAVEMLFISFFFSFRLDAVYFQVEIGKREKNDYKRES